MSLFAWMNWTLSQNSTNQTDVNWKVQQIINATCACSSQLNGSALYGGGPYGRAAFQALNTSMDPLNYGANGVLFTLPSSPTAVIDYNTQYCPTLTGRCSTSSPRVTC